MNTILITSIKQHIHYECFSVSIELNLPTNYKISSFDFEDAHIRSLLPTSTTLSLHLQKHSHRP